MTVVSKEHVIEEIRRTAADNGGQPLGQRSFATSTGIRDSDWLGKHWLRWSDALTEAGFEPNLKTRAISEERLLELYATVARDVGHLPLKSERQMRAHKDPSFPAYQTFLKFGGRSVLHARLAEWGKKNDFADVAAMCEAATIATEPATKRSKAASPVVGWVYLLKSGRFHKIGFSNAVGRRQREIALKLPEDAVLVHEISTDDPAGIEQYWHKRFADKRAKGEWFSLSPADVAAFKRRQFM